MSWYSKACPVCGGDLYDEVRDPGWVTCMLCGREFVAKDVLAVQRFGRRPAPRKPFDEFASARALPVDAERQAS